MPAKHTWTEAEDLHIKRLRQTGAQWDDIAASLGIHRSTAITRGRQIGASHPLQPPRPSPEALALLDPARDPLPAGHAISWAILTAGTLLEGSPFRLEDAAA